MVLISSIKSGKIIYLYSVSPAYRQAGCYGEVDYSTMYQPVILPYFKKQLKTHVKKHRNLKKDILLILQNFQKNQNIHLGKNVYKIRLGTKTLPRGKNKSFRLIILVVEIEKMLVPITIYFKGGKRDITIKELNYHLTKILFELNC